MPLIDMSLHDPVVDANWAAKEQARKLQPKPVTAAGVFWAVFGALWLFSATAGAVIFLVRLLRV